MLCYLLFGGILAECEVVFGGAVRCAPLNRGVDMRMTNRLGSLLVVAAVTVLLAGGCKNSVPTSGAEGIDEAVELLKGHNFGEEYRKALSLLDAAIENARTKKDGRERRVGYEALLWRGKAHLQLLVAAIVSKEDKLLELLKEISNWDLEGGLDDIKSFQLLAQDVLEEFRVVAREGKDYSDLKSEAERLSAFVAGLQGIHYRNKAKYFLGSAEVRKVKSMAYLDDLMALRDLQFETVERGGGLPNNWHNVALTVLGRVCERPAAQFLAMICVATDPSSAQEFCANTLTEIPDVRRQQGAQHLRQACTVTYESGDQTVTLSGMDAVRHYYGENLKALRATEGNLPQVLRTSIDRAESGMEEAYKRLDEQFFLSGAKGSSEKQGKGDEEKK